MSCPLGCSAEKKGWEPRWKGADGAKPKKTNEPNHPGVPRKRLQLNGLRRGFERAGMLILLMSILMIRNNDNIIVLPTGEA